MGKKFGQATFDYLMVRMADWVPGGGLLNLSSAALVLSITESDVLKISEIDLPRYPMIVGSHQWSYCYLREDCAGYIIDCEEAAHEALHKKRRAERRAKKRIEEQMKQSNKEPSPQP